MNHQIILNRKIYSATINTLRPNKKQDTEVLVIS